MIKDFDLEKYLEANIDVKEEIEKGTFKSAIEHLEKFGLEEIKKGIRKFHPDFEPYNEEEYLNRFLDIKKAVEKDDFKNGFEHFCLFGYKEIVEYKRTWKQANKVENDLCLIFGIPRSGITLTTYLMSFKENYTTWFLPFSTRKNFGIPHFDSIETIKEEYSKIFPNREVKDRFVLSESTANSEVFEWLKNGILQSDIDYSIIWMFRNINESFLSLKEAARKYWGDNENNINFEAYKQYIDFVKNSFFNTFKLFYQFSEKAHCFTLSNVVKGDLESIYKLNVKEFSSNFNKYDIAGDPAFLEKNFIDNDVVNKRKEEWKHYEHFYNELDEKDKKFVDFYNELVEFININPNITLREIIDNYALKYFNKEYYINTYEDIKKIGVNPFEHYISIGYKEKRKPAEDIENINTDYIEGMHPFVYYIFVEQFEERKEEPKIMNDDDIYGRLELKLIDPENYEINENLKLKAPYFKNPKVSIIIPAYNQANYTLACVDSIIRHTKGVSYEIIIMDDNSPDPKAKEIEKYMENVIFISNGINYGFLENCNKGARLAKGEYILFLNNDTNVQPGWLSSLVELIESDNKIGMVGSKLVYPNGQQQEAGGIVWKDASAWNFGRLDNPLKPEYNYVKEADYISGASIMIKKDLWEEIGGFDVRYKPAYFEDTDLAFEVRKHGYKVMLQPKSVVVHFEGISHGTDTSSGVKRYQVVNKDKFIDKWKDILEKEQFPNGEHVFLARDRSRFKPCILFIDHYLPHYDEDAGSRTIYSYMKFFVENNFNVKFIGDNFYNYPDKPYLDELNQMGVEVLWGNYYANNWKDWLKENGQYIDYVFLSRPHVAIKYIDEIKANTNAKILYYGHDLHYLRTQREYELIKDEKLINMAKEWREIEEYLFKQSDVVYYLSDFEKKEIEKEYPDVNVQIMPTFIYDKFERIPYDFNNRKDLMFVGGFAHTPNVDGVLWFVNKVFPLILQKIPDIHFYIIGSKPPKEILELNKHNNITVTGFISDEELDNYYNKCRLAVVPLRVGAGVKGKVIEAIYKQIPVVTTSIGAEGIKGVENILTIADNEEEFAEKVVNLYNNEQLLKTIAEKSFEYAKNNFSFKKVKEIFSKDIKFRRKEFK